MLIDPKAPLDTIPEYMVKQPSNYLISGSFLYNTFHLISFICTMILLSVFLPEFFQSEWTTQAFPKV